jgi:hypothetical protein
MEEFSPADRLTVTCERQNPGLKETDMTFNRRRFLPFSLSLTILLGGLIPAAEGNGGQTGFCEKIKPCQLLAQSDAEKILGQPVRLTQDTSVLKGDVRQCICAYTGVNKDTATGQDRVLYFSLEQKEGSPSAEQAHQLLVSTKEANAHDAEIADLTGVGEEAFLLSNDLNSHLIMARKGAIIMRLQVKRAAGEKSADTIKAFAEKASKHF